MIDDNEDLPFDVSTDVVDDLDHIFAQTSLCETDDGTFFTAGNPSVSSAALARRSMTVSTSGSEFADLLRN